MSAGKFDFDKLVTLLGRSENDTEVQNFFGQRMLGIERDEFYGTLEFKTKGVDVVFKEAPWVVPLEKITEPKELYLAAFHLHRNGHEGYEGYPGALPNGLFLGDPESEVIRKMGEPIQTGGGGMSHLFNGIIPRWFWYPLNEAILHVQFDAKGNVQMVTPCIPDLKSGTNRDK